MKVLVKVKDKWVAAIGVPCGQGDSIEIRDGSLKGFYSGRGKKWKRADGRRSTHGMVKS